MKRIRVRLLLALTAASAAIGAALLWYAFQPSHETAGATEPAWDPDVEGYDENLSSSNTLRSELSTDAGQFVDRHCATCHSGKKPKANLILVSGLDPPSQVDRASWVKAAEAVRSGRMPPRDRMQPTPGESAAFLAWVEAGHSPSSRVTLRRLNRAEYDNTIRDLVGVSFQPARDFPADDTSEGFDTIGDVLSVSPTLIEKYLTVAEKVVDSAAADPELWHRLCNPPVEDFVPFVLRGTPPLRDPVVKGQQSGINSETAEHTAMVDRAYFALRTFADRAYRRPITHVEMDRLMRFVEATLNNGEGADPGFKLALKAVLVSPHFLFKIESDPDTAKPNTDRRLNDYELATRMSYFLWSSLPDEELFRLAAGGKLHDPRTLVDQVRRMLKDPKSRALADHFAGQWLQTRSLDEANRDPAQFARFDEDLRRAMRNETELFFDHVVREDGNVLDFLTGEYTFVNERLAHHYGLTGVTGDEFRRVSLAGTSRAGVLTHASVLTVTSNPTRTSPVKRGKWILENLLGTPAPPPPPGVDTLSESTTATTTLRERLDHHRSRAECASCHSRMDPLGFGLENFDATGAWRDRDGKDPIDASGTLPDGRLFRGPGELRKVLAEKSDDFVRCLTEKLMTYALGRGLTPADRPEVDRIVRHTCRNGYRFSSLASRHRSK